MKLSAHDDDALSIDLQRPIVPFYDCLEAIIGSKCPQQHS